MKRLLTAVLLMAATGAQALDCRVFDPAQRFMYADESDSEVVIAMGQFELVGNELPDCQGDGEVSSTTSSGRFVGQGLTQDGFTAVMAIPIRIQRDCMTPITDQSALFSEPTIAFLDVTDRGYLLSIDYCEINTYPADPATAAMLTACIRGEACGTAAGQN